MDAYILTVNGETIVVLASSLSEVDTKLAEVLIFHYEIETIADKLIS